MASINDVTEVRGFRCHSWAQVNNWLPSGVPATADAVYIPAGNPNDPTTDVATIPAAGSLTTLFTVNGGDLTVDTTDTVAVTGDVNIQTGTTLTGNGTIQVGGDWKPAASRSTVSAR